MNQEVKIDLYSDFEKKELDNISKGLVSNKLINTEN